MVLFKTFNRISGPEDYFQFSPSLLPGPPPMSPPHPATTNQEEGMPALIMSLMFGPVNSPGSLIKLNDYSINIQTS